MAKINLPNSNDEETKTRNGELTLPRSHRSSAVEIESDLSALLTTGY